MRRLLLRAAVITGGCAAGIILSLSISGEAHADDRPRLLGGLSDTVTGVVDTVLPDAGHKPDKPDKDKDDKPNKDEDKNKDEEPQQEAPSRPIRDTVEEVVNEVIEQIEPPNRPDDTPESDKPTDPEPTPDTNPDESAATPDELATVDPAADPVTEPLDPAQAVPALNATSVTPTATTAYEAPASYPTGGGCGHEHHGARPDRQRMAAKTPAERRETAAPGYSSPPPSTPSRSGHDATPSIATPCSPYAGPQQDATLTARASMPRTTAVRIPGRDQAADGRTRRPDAPSG